MDQLETAYVEEYDIEDEEEDFEDEDDSLYEEEEEAEVSQQ